MQVIGAWMLIHAPVHVPAATSEMDVCMRVSVSGCRCLHALHDLRACMATYHMLSASRDTEGTSTCVTHRYMDAAARARPLALEAQFVDADVEALCKPLASNVWCTSLRLDVYSLPGFICDKGAECLAQALRDNRCLCGLRVCIRPAFVALSQA